MWDYLLSAAACVLALFVFLHVMKNAENPDAADAEDETEATAEAER